jgi:YgiT-type zinc finger domain-containing protein
MKELKSRPCPECGTMMEPRSINLHYERKGSDLHVEVIGIPANVCPRCFSRLIPADVAKQIDGLVDPLYERVDQQDREILPVPHIDIQFPLQERPVSQS